MGLWRFPAMGHEQNSAKTFDSYLGLRLNTKSQLQQQQHFIIELNCCCCCCCCSIWDLWHIVPIFGPDRPSVAPFLSRQSVIRISLRNKSDCITNQSDTSVDSEARNDNFRKILTLVFGIWQILRFYVRLFRYCAGQVAFTQNWRTTDRCKWRTVHVNLQEFQSSV